MFLVKKNVSLGSCMHQNNEVNIIFVVCLFETNLCAICQTSIPTSIKSPLPLVKSHSEHTSKLESPIFKNIWKVQLLNRVDKLLGTTAKSLLSHALLVCSLAVKLMRQQFWLDRFAPCSNFHAARMLTLVVSSSSCFVLCVDFVWTSCADILV